MKHRPLNIKVWIGILAMLSILFGFAGQAYCETLTAVCVDSMDAAMIECAHGKKAAQVVVTVVDETGSPVADLSVAGKWSMLLKGRASGVTGADGRVTFVSGATGKSGIVCFTVTDVSGAGVIYDPSRNMIDEIRISTDVTANQKPVAEIAILPATMGVLPMTVNLDGSNSYDPDGTIVSYDWDFGDSWTATGENASHTYTAAGTYLATLTVTDDGGAINTDAIEITVTQADTKAVYVSYLGLFLSSGKRGTVVNAVISVVDEDGNDVPNATVNGEWSGILNYQTAGVTDCFGTVSLYSAQTKKKRGSITFTVTNITAAGYTYDPGRNVQTSETVTLP